MILLLMTLAASVPASPVMRLGPPTPDGGASVDIINSRGKVATRVVCPPNQWVDPRDSARSLIASTAVMATILALDGRLTSNDQLGPARYACVIVLPRAG
jgi:hypothetical protein